jgi:hypothetical protein
VGKSLLDGVEEVCCKLLSLRDYQNSKVRVGGYLPSYIVHSDGDGLGVVRWDVNKDTVISGTLLVLHRGVVPGRGFSLYHIHQVLLVGKGLLVEIALAKASEV